MAGWKVVLLEPGQGREIPHINHSIYLLQKSGCDITDSNTINLAWKPALYIENLLEMKIKKEFANQEVMQLRINQSTAVKYTSHHTTNSLLMNNIVILTSFTFLRV